MIKTDVMTAQLSSEIASDSFVKRVGSSVLSSGKPPIARALLNDGCLCDWRASSIILLSDGSSDSGFEPMIAALPNDTVPVFSGRSNQLPPILRSLEKETDLLSGGGSGASTGLRMVSGAYLVGLAPTIFLLLKETVWALAATAISKVKANSLVWKVQFIFGRELLISQYQR